LLGGGGLFYQETSGIKKAGPSNLYKNGHYSGNKFQDTKRP